MQTARHAHNRSRAVGFALVAGGFIFRRIPAVRDPPSFGGEGHRGVVALGRRDHPELPVFTDDRYPVTGQIDCCGGFGRHGGLCAALAAAAAALLSIRGGGDGEKQANGKRANRRLHRVWSPTSIHRTAVSAYSSSPGTRRE